MGQYNGELRLATKLLPINILIIHARGCLVDLVSDSSLLTYRNDAKSRST